MNKKKESEKAIPFFARIYRRHKKIIKTVSKDKKISETEVVRLAIEEMGSRHVVAGK